MSLLLFLVKCYPFLSAFLSIENGHKMSAFSFGIEMKSQMVESTLREVLAVITPSEQDSMMRYNLIKELQEAVKSVPSLRGATVEAFGSFVSNLYTKLGDLDISINLPAGSFVGKEDKRALLWELHSALSWKGGFKNLQPILNAQVPILKLESREGIYCDISIDNKEGENKSKMLLWLSQIDRRFCEMILLVKEWAKTHSINCSKDGSFSSYSLSLLVIFHFQTCVPAIFPPLREFCPENAGTGFVNVANENVRRACASNIAKFKSDTFRRANTSSLDELFNSFITKFADINLSASNLSICPFTGEWEGRRNQEFSLIVEDPFEWRQNACRHVSAEKLVRISEAFQTTLAALEQGDQNRSNLLKMLVRPSIAELIPKSSTSYESYGRTGPVFYRVVEKPHHHSYVRGTDEHQSTRNLGSAMQNQHLMMHMAPQVDRYGCTVETPAAESSEGSSQWLSGVKKAGLVFGALAGAMIGVGALVAKSREEKAKERDDD